MKRQHTILTPTADIYEVIIEHSVITQITHYINRDLGGRIVQWHDIPEAAQHHIIEKLVKNENRLKRRTG